MPFTEMEKSIFASFSNDSKFLSNDNQKNMIAAMFLCTPPRVNTKYYFFFKIHQKLQKIPEIILHINFSVKNLTNLIFTLKK